MFALVAMPLGGLLELRFWSRGASPVPRRSRTQPALPDLRGSMGASLEGKTGIACKVSQSEIWWLRGHGRPFLVIQSKTKTNTKISLEDEPKSIEESTRKTTQDNHPPTEKKGKKSWISPLIFN